MIKKTSRIRRFHQVLAYLFHFTLGIMVSVPPRAESAFALVRDQTGRFFYGRAADQPTEERAKMEALADCHRSSGRTCSIISSFNMGCFAFAAAPRGPAGYAAGGRDVDAEQKAMHICSQRPGGHQCALRVSFCDSTSEQMQTILSNLKRAREVLAKGNTFGTPCSLSGKRIVASNLLLDVVGKNVLFHENQGGRGMALMFGQTLDLTAEKSQLRYDGVPLPRHPGRIETAQGSVAFDGGELRLLLESVFRTRGYTQQQSDGMPHHLPDNVPLMVGTAFYRVEISNCSSCILREFTIRTQGYVGPEFTKSSPNSRCTIEDIKR